MDKIVFVLLGFSFVFASQEERFNYHYTCPKNFTNIGRKCYHLNNGTATWFQSYYTCKDLSKSNLTTFSSRQDLYHFESYLFKYKHRFISQNSLYWVGGFKDWKQKKWIYTDGTPVKFISMTETAADNWTCLLFDIDKKRWRAENCMNQNPFICQTEPQAMVGFKFISKKVDKKLTLDECNQQYLTLTKKQKKRCLKLRDRMQNKHPAAVIQKSKPAYQTKPTAAKAKSYICPQNWMILGSQCYLFSREKVTWSDAHFNCLHISSKLAIIRSKVQDKRLKIFLNGFTEKQERWIGGRYNDRTREWVWALSGKKLKYHGFAGESLQNQRNLTNWQAIIMDPQYAYQWNFKNEMEKHFYICQTKGMAVKKVNPPRGTTIEITSNPRYSVRSRTNRRANRKKRH